MPRDRRDQYTTYPAESGGLRGNDLMIVDGSGESHGYVLTADTSYGQPCIHTKSRPNPPLNIGRSTAADAGGQYDVRDADGSKAITHINWTGGAGQKSLDGENASAYKFLESKNIDIETPGKLTLLREATYTAKAGITGPFYSALGYVWAGCTNGNAYFSTNGDTWYISTGLPAGDLITSFTSDGRFIYASVGSGSTPGVYKGTLTAGSPPTVVFAKIGSSSTEKVSAVCFHAGFFFASQDYVVSTTDSKAAMLDANNNYGFSSICTPAQMKNFTTADLVQAGNAVYWVVCQGDRSYIYELIFNPDTQTMSTQQFAEFPSGFVATCAVGYLSTVYVGGYWRDSTSNVGQGQVYECDSGITAPLFFIGDRPHDTDYPANPENDNRIWSIAAGERDLFVNTNRGVYRWDIDNGGYSHVFDLMGSGQGTTTMTWDSGSDYSWDGTDYTVVDPPHHMFPTKWVDTPYDTPVWTFDTGVATQLGGGTEVEITDITLDNTNGSTVEIKTGDGYFFGGIYYAVRDGVTEGYFEITNSFVALHRWVRLGTMEYTNEPVFDWEQADEVNSGWVDNWGYRWVAANGVYGWSDPYHYDAWPAAPAGKTYIAEFPSLYITTTPNVSKTVRFTLEGTTATLSVNGNTSTTLTTNDTKSTASADRMWFDMTNGVIIDYININSTGYYPPGWETEILSYAGLTHHNGDILCPYSVPSYATSKVVATSSHADPSVISCAAHGFSNSDSVTIEGHSESECNDTFTITYIGAGSFSIPIHSDGGTGGWAYLENECKEGVAKTGTDFAESGYLTQSETNFHTGTMLKDFRYIDVAHNYLPTGSELECVVWIDGDPISLVGERSGNYTRFIIDRSGYSIKTSLYMTRGSKKKRSRDTAPIIGAINVMWDFIKTRRHTYLLDIRTGAQAGNWGENPEEAVEFLWKITDQRATFQDAFTGLYDGMVEETSFYKANYSTHEGVSGIVKLVVREEL